jgi:hypothetical protein
MTVGVCKSPSRESRNGIRYQKSRTKQKKYPEERQVKVEVEKTTDMTAKECKHKTTQI